MLYPHPRTLGGGAGGVCVAAISRAPSRLRQQVRVVSLIGRGIVVVSTQTSDSVLTVAFRCDAKRPYRKGRFLTGRAIRA